MKMRHTSGSFPPTWARISAARPTRTGSVAPRCADRTRWRARLVWAWEAVKIRKQWGNKVGTGRRSRAQSRTGGQPPSGCAVRWHVGRGTSTVRTPDPLFAAKDPAERAGHLWSVRRRRTAFAVRVQAQTHRRCRCSVTSMSALPAKAAPRVQCAAPRGRRRGHPA